MDSAQGIVHRDLTYIHEKLAEDFGNLAGKRLLITGGAGFLGYYLVQTILQWNRQVDREKQIDLAVYDNYIRGVPRWLTDLSDSPKITLTQHNIISPLPADVGDFQYIIHAAGIASPIYYRLHPIETMDANVIGLRNLLDYFCRQKADQKPVEGFLFFSSSEIYGDPSPENIPTPETYRGFVSCTGPRACYDESKRFGETLCVNFAQQYELPIRVARPFNNYGPGLKITDRRVIPDFAANILANQDMNLLSDGSPKRTFCYVADAVVGYFKVLLRGKAGEAYNIGVESPEISIADLASRMAAIGADCLGYQGKVVHQTSQDANYLVDNPNRRCPSIAKARAQIGYSPEISLDEGLLRSLLWYRDNRFAEEA